MTTANENKYCISRHNLPANHNDFSTTFSRHFESRFHEEVRGG